MAEKVPGTDAPGGLAWIFLAQNMPNRYLGILAKKTKPPSFAFFCLRDFLPDGGQYVPPRTEKG